MTNTGLRPVPSDTDTDSEDDDDESMVGSEDGRCERSGEAPVEHEPKGPPSTESEKATRRWARSRPATRWPSRTAAARDQTGERHMGASLTGGASPLAIDGRGRTVSIQLYTRRRQITKRY